MLAFALRNDGWWWRDEIIWHKPNPMPASVKDRTTHAHEYVLMFAKQENYYYDLDAIREKTGNESTWDEYLNGGTRNKERRDNKTLPPKGGSKFGVKGGDWYCVRTFTHPKGRHPRSVWTIPTQQFRHAHFATFPEKLIEPCVLAGSRKGDFVLDPFMGSGTTALVAKRLGRQYLGIELNPYYLRMAEARIGKTAESDSGGMRS
jgi:DNA modification methylase